jgi:hypothetical protein
MVESSTGVLRLDSAHRELRTYDEEDETASTLIFGAESVGLRTKNKSNRRAERAVRIAIHESGVMLEENYQGTG